MWKFAGLNPDIRWGEYDFDNVFASGRDQYEEKTAEAVTALAANGIPAKEPLADAMEVTTTPAEVEPVPAHLVEVQPAPIAA